VVRFQSHPDGILLWALEGLVDWKYFKRGYLPDVCCNVYQWLVGVDAVMDKLDREQLYNTAWKHWGSDSQLDMLIEEMAELTRAILKTRRNGVAFSYAMYEEMADVSICMEQVETQLRKYPRFSKHHAPCEENGTDWDIVESIRDRKLQRMKERLMQSMTDKLNGAGD
jgi:NTP pyrophosphatase (non-canonical NTP hydrolase)